MPALLVLLLVAPALLVLLAFATVGVRDLCGGCPARARFAAPSGPVGSSTVEGE